MFKFKIIKLQENPTKSRLEVVTQMIDCEGRQITFTDPENPDKVKYNMYARLYIKVKDAQDEIFWNSKIDNTFLIDLKFN